MIEMIKFGVILTSPIIINNVLSIMFNFVNIAPINAAASMITVIVIEINVKIISKH